ncbi:hypothetical protein [Bordetella genomosp. 13]|uniref:Uncharacterized protein n=1 Tax=Bordetella genomosp. 13 TaxID=463040 RepID=A0A1W6Z7I4_9BORD|nr:hypothetical protein [Bordetella genomosp. 13]ARP93267.1 hypothetical protein CAL15_02010 [Bordetella genomosp. 13]
MSDLSLNTTNVRLTDALERELLRGAMENPSSLRPANVLKSAVSGIARAIGNLFAFVDEVQESMNRARAQNARFTGSQW